MSSRSNLAPFERRENAAIRFGSMETIAKATSAFERGFKSGEEMCGLEWIDIDRDKILETRRIDEKSPAR